MKLQVSLDFIDLEKALAVAQQVAEYADILEIGSLLLFKHGVYAVERLRAQHPKKTLLVDAKITEQGKDATDLLITAGADFVTTMAGAPKEVTHGAATRAHAANKKVMLDLADAASFGQSALEAKTLGVDALLLHYAYNDDTALVFKDTWEMVRGNTSLPIFLSAHIDRNNVEKLIPFAPDGIIVSRAITEAENPAEAAQFFAAICGR